MYVMLLNQVVTSLINFLTQLHSHKTCSIVSSSFEQNVHFGSFVSLILHRKVFVAKILWLILV